MADLLHSANGMVRGIWLLLVGGESPLAAVFSRLFFVTLFPSGAYSLRIGRSGTQQKTAQ